MSDVTQILPQIDARQGQVADLLLPLPCDDHRKLATQYKSWQAFHAAAPLQGLHIRLIDVEKARRWDRRRHFFASAAEEMRWISAIGGHYKGPLCPSTASKPPRF